MYQIPRDQVPTFARHTPFELEQLVTCVETDTGPASVRKITSRMDAGEIMFTIVAAQPLNRYGKVSVWGETIRDWRTITLTDVPQSDVELYVRKPLFLPI